MQNSIRDSDADEEGETDTVAAGAAGVINVKLRENKPDAALAQAKS